MLALVERVLDSIRKSRTDTDIIGVLAEISASLGFRSGFLIEYAADLKSALHILDSNPQREGWLQDYVATGLSTDQSELAALLAEGGVQTFDGSRFGAESRLLSFARRVDIVELVLVPVSFDGAVIGLGGFSGNPPLTAGQKTALQLVVYSLFAQTRSFRASGSRTATEPLTPREKEVIRLSADGLTSQEIALQLGMSPRTVNQHVDNVADKLGTRNRAHTVAEAIRHGLLN
ncbi:LuxR family quorum sensing-dependent transcriptional regulator [Devosia sp. UYZn731]